MQHISISIGTFINGSNHHSKMDYLNAPKCLMTFLSCAIMLYVLHTFISAEQGYFLEYVRDFML